MAEVMVCCRGSSLTTPSIEQGQGEGSIAYSDLISARYTFNNTLYPGDGYSWSPKSPANGTKMAKTQSNYICRWNIWEVSGFNWIIRDEPPGLNPGGFTREHTDIDVLSLSTWGSVPPYSSASEYAITRSHWGRLGLWTFKTLSQISFLFTI